MKAPRGFTIIEISVVIFVILLISSLMLVSLSSSKRRGNDTALKADLSTVQIAGTQYFSIGNTYGVTNTGATASCSLAGTVFNDTTTTIDDPVGKAIAGATKNAQGNVLVCRSTSSAFLVAGQLTNGHYWCADSVGSTTEMTSQPGNTLTACP